MLRRQQAALILRGLGGGGRAGNADAKGPLLPGHQALAPRCPMFRMEAHRHKLRMMGISPMDNTQSEHLAWPKAVAITGQQWERGITKPRVGGNRILQQTGTNPNFSSNYPGMRWQLPTPPLPPSTVCGKRWQKRPVVAKPGCQEEGGRGKVNVACGHGRGHKEPGHLPTKLCAHGGDSDQQKGVLVPAPRCWKPGRHDPERRLRARSVARSAA